MQKILFPTDFSPMANHAFGYALAFASHYMAEIRVLHAYHYSGSEARIAPMEVLEDIHSSRKEEAFEQFQAYKDQAEKIGFRHLAIEPLASYGFAAEMILEACEELQPDFVIMGSKGDSGLSDRIFGSVSLRVIREATAMVLAIPQAAVFSPLHILFYAAATEKESNSMDPLLEEVRRKLHAEIAYVHIPRKNHRDIVTKLNEILSEIQADAVVVSPNQHSFFEDLLHPSITEQLTETLRIPIIAIH